MGLPASAADRLLVQLSALCAPVFAVQVATWIFNQVKYGDWQRNGYKLWNAVPYDYPELVFSFGNVGKNLASLDHLFVWHAVILGGAGIAALAVRRERKLIPLLAFLLLGAGSVFALHLVYYWSDLRFHLLWMCLACAIGGAGVLSLLPQRIRRHEWIVPPLLVAGFFFPEKPPDPPQEKRIVADVMAEVLPDDAIVVSAIEPVYLEPLLVRGTRRKVVPFSRRVEYASKFVTWKKVDPLVPPAVGPRDPRAPGLRAGGAEDPVPFTADEGHAQIDAWVREGRPVFFDASHAGNARSRQAMLGSTLRLAPHTVHAWLARIEPVE